MEEQKTSTASIALKWGAISGIISFIITVITSSLKLNGDPTMGIVSTVVSIALTIVTLILAMKNFKSGNNDYMSFGQGLGIGTLTGAIWGVVAGALNLVYTKFIDNSAITQAMAKAREQWEAQGMSDEQIEQASKWGEMMSNPGIAFVITVITGVIIGAVLSLIISAVLKKEKSIFE
jgi:uncharacterized integral membrane protein